jgi:hypothetical protein
VSAADHEHRQLARHLSDLVSSRLLDPLEIVLQSDLTRLRRQIDTQARRWADQLLGPDDAVATGTAIRLVSALYPGDEPFHPSPQWWSTTWSLAGSWNGTRPAGSPTRQSAPGSMRAAAQRAGPSRGVRLTVDSKPATPAGRLQLGEMSVGRLGFGAMQLPGPGSWGPAPDKDAALAVLCRAVEMGVEYIDTADFYGPHVANELIREARPAKSLPGCGPRRAR